MIEDWKYKNGNLMTAGVVKKKISAQFDQAYLDFMENWQFGIEDELREVGYLEPYIREVMASIDLKIKLLKAPQPFGRGLE